MLNIEKYDEIELYAKEKDLSELFDALRQGGEIEFRHIEMLTISAPKQLQSIRANDFVRFGLVMLLFHDSS